MKPTQKHIAAISAAINMYFDGMKEKEEVRRTENLISPWKSEIINYLPYSHNRAIGGWNSKSTTRLIS
jgi:hypothetical protein|tara:strand:+ start:990 stop:1193 length:204 start_codon:yes stop_codon:yes gene_type:complete